MVVGDLLLDQFVWGKVSRISPEAPVPVVWVEDENYMPGGACNVANNLAELGSRVCLVGIVGEDERAKILLSLLRERGIDISGIFHDKTRQTILKTRVMAHHHPHHQQIVRIDRESVDSVSDKYSKSIIDHIAQNLKKIDGVIIEDYGKGLISRLLLGKIIRLAKKHGKFVAVDPKENHFSYYKRVSVITPNRSETERAVGFTLDSDDAIKKAGEKLLGKLKTEAVLITLGEEGMMLCEKGRPPRKIPTLAQDVFDVSGAGDTVIGTYTLSLVSGGSPIVAAYIANCAAGIVVSRTGTAVVDKQELLKKLKTEAGKAEK
jgi:D-beta-D-heptose 7-phosphate kinase/D-beta-D-heptose 1-phosphate adenosyltransferase